ncbi:MAG: LOG family protein [Melioribacteraceae bacterium]
MNNQQKKYQIGIIGSAGNDDYNGAQGATDNMITEAEKIGSLLAKNNVIVITGGKSGIMEAGAKGAKEAGGQTVGVVKGVKRFTSNNFTDVEVISGMEADGFDELLLVNMCDALIVIGGGAGTLEEITIAYRNKKPIIALTTQAGWAKELAGKFLDNRNTIKIETASNAEEAVNKTLQLLAK